MKITPRLVFDLLLVAAILGLAGAWWWKVSEPAQPIGVAVVAKPAAAVAKAPTETVQTAPVIAYTAPAKRRLRLPDAVQANANQHVLGAASVAADDHPHTVTTVLDASTGQTTTYDVREPLPWMAIDTHGEAGLAYGLKNGVQTVRLEARQGLLDIKAVRIGVTASLDQPLAGPLGADYFVGLGAWYRW